MKRNMKIALTLFSLIFFTFAAKLSAQTVEGDYAEQKGKKTIVTIPLTVSDREGRYVSDLKKGDFLVYQSGIEQKVSSLKTYDEPLEVALLLDTSGSTKSSLKEIKDAAKDFVELLNPNDKCLIATFDSEVKVLSTLTDSHKILKNSLNQVRTADKEGSVVLDAVKDSVKKSFSNSEGRKVIVLLSDGKDFGSSISKNELLSQLEESDISVYTIFYQSGQGINKLTVNTDGTIKEEKESKPQKIKKPKKQKKYSILIPTRGDVYSDKDAKLISKATNIEAANFLLEISDTTAGRFYQSDAPNLSGIFKKIARELRQQYRLVYYTKENSGKGSTPEIIVKVKQPDAVVRPLGKFRAKQL